jgi:protein ImuA
MVVPSSFAIRPLPSITHPKLFRIGDAPSAARPPCLPTGFATLDRELVDGGWPQQGLIELLCDDVGIGEASLMLPAHAYLGNVRHLGPKGMLWVTATTWPYLPYAPAVAQSGADLNQLVIANAPQMQDALWAAEQGLLSGSMGIVMVWLSDQQPSDVSLRRLLQTANNSNALCVLARPVAVAARPSPAQLRIVLKAVRSRATNLGAIEVQLLKRRGLPAGKTIVLQTRVIACLQRQRTDEYTAGIHKNADQQHATRGWLDCIINSASTSVANIRQRSFELDR